MNPESANIVPHTDAETEALESARVDQVRKRINAASWSSDIEDLLKAWGEKAAGSKLLHLKSAQQWSSISNNMYVPLIALTTAGGVATIGAAGDESPAILMYAVGAMNAAAAFFASMIKYHKPDEKAQNHLVHARMFGAFYRRISLQLGLAREDRTNVEALTTWATNELDRIQHDAPTIPSRVIKAYMEEHRDDEHKPDVVMESFVITVKSC